MQRIINKSILQETSHILTSQERYILTKRSGLDGPIETLKRIAIDLNMFYYDVQQLEQTAYQKVIEYLNNKDIDSKVFSSNSSEKNNHVTMPLNAYPKLAQRVTMKKGLLRMVQTSEERKAEIKRLYKKLKR